MIGRCGSIDNEANIRQGKARMNGHQQWPIIISYLKTSTSRVTLLLLGAVDGSLSARTLSAGRFAFSASHY